LSRSPFDTEPVDFIEHPLSNIAHTRTKWQQFSKLRIVVFSTEHPILETLGSLKGTQMNAWSTYLRTQAVLADRVSKTMTTAATIKEFADYAAALGVTQTPRIEHRPTSERAAASSNRPAEALFRKPTHPTTGPDSGLSEQTRA
jgi:hypothetical protein